MSDLTQDELKARLSYDPESGVFTRLTTYKRFKAGDVAGYTNKKGYISIGISGKYINAHRLAFLYMTGGIPDEIDHINRDRSDNRWENLRACDRVTNMRNMGISSVNKSGVTGVHWSTSANKWCARIGVIGERKSLGCFDSLEEARAARKLAEINLGFHPNHGTRI